MPIQFTCDHCHGVLSIAKRKAYSLIDCPKCGCKQVVPSESRSLRKKDKNHTHASELVAVAEAHQGINEQALKDLPLFERNDFENLLLPPNKSKKDVTAETKPAHIVDAVIVSPGKSSTAITAVKSASVPPTSGVELIHTKDRIVLKKFHVVLAAILVFIVIGLAFGTGFMLSRTLGSQGAVLKPQ